MTPTNPPNSRFAWHTAPLVTIYVPTPACPYCGSQRYITVRSEANGDGSVTRKTICAQCSKKFKVLVEPLPSNGNWD